MGSQRFTGIQVARAIAALSVCYFHSWGALERFPHGTAHPISLLAEYGWVGVDLFFAISGFVICVVATKEIFDVRDFLIRRVFRLYPLWLLMLTLYAVAAWRWRGLLPTESLGYFFYSATLLPTENFPFYDIGWSLQHEMVFYLLTAAIVPLFGIAGLIVFLSVSAAASLFLEMPWYISHLSMYHGEFLAGVLAYLALPAFRKLGATIPLIVGFVLLCFFFNWETRPYFPIALFFLIVGFASLGTSPEDPAAILGDASYSIYLIHPLLFMTVRSVTIKFYDIAPLWIEEPLRFGAIGGVIVLAILSYRYFELPILQFGNSVAKGKALIAPSPSR